MIFCCCTSAERVLGGCSGKDRKHAVAGTQKPLVGSAISHFLYHHNSHSTSFSISKSLVLIAISHQYIEFIYL